MAMSGKTGMVQIDEAYCKGCTLCINACPQHLLHVSKKVSKTSYHPAEFVDSEEKCTGCSLCGIVCPDSAIKVYRKRVGVKK
jgi:2-oxoglutarate ferredoxin oxidoreductase subunit delta